MAKAKYKDNGNIKVTMSEEQWFAVLAILHHVRLGGATQLGRAITDLVIDLDEFDADFNEMLDHYNPVVAVKNPYSDKPKDLEDWCLELR